MYTFPSWVEPRNEVLTDAERAYRRLRFLVGIAAVHATAKTSISALAMGCEAEGAQIHAAMREGQFSAKMAARIEKQCGRNIVKREWLMYPLEIEELITQ